MDITRIFEAPDTSVLAGAVQSEEQRAAEFYRRLAEFQQQYNQQLSQQGALARNYDQVIAGTVPSVAGTQLMQGLDRNRAGINAQAAGASGQNAAMANYGGIQALAAAQAKAEQDAALLRAQEVAAARAGKGQLLQGMQTATGQQSGIAAGAGGTAAGHQVQAGGALTGASTAEKEAERAFVGNLMGAFGKAFQAGAMG